MLQTLWTKINQKVQVPSRIPFRKETTKKGQNKNKTDQAYHISFLIAPWSKKCLLSQIKRGVDLLLSSSSRVLINGSDLS